jgi:hypothetical protein
MSTLRRAQRILLAERMRAKEQKDKVTAIMAFPKVSELHGIIKHSTTCKICCKELAVGTPIKVIMGNQLMMAVCDNEACISKAKELINESLKDKASREGKDSVSTAEPQVKTES